MKIFQLVFFLTINIIFCVVESTAENLDAEWLSNYVEVNKLEPIRNEPIFLDGKFYLGRALFFDKILSTNKDVSCSTCHLVSNATVDSLPMSIGAGGVQLGKKRYSTGEFQKMHRNAPALFNLDNNEVKNLFWDGRVSVDLHGDIKFVTPLKRMVPLSIENALSAQALLPIFNLNELRSSICLLSSNEQDICEKLYASYSKVNKELWNITYLSFIKSRVLGNLAGGAPLNTTQTKYRELFKKAYPTLSLEQMDIGHFANAIARYQEIAFATRDTPWDNFLTKKIPLTIQEAYGARLFFGKFKCQSCHSNTLFSDFDFHFIGKKNNKQSADIDNGRYDITGNSLDKYKFRTPSLRNVTITPPYMHDGSLPTLVQAIQAHFSQCQEGTDNVCIENTVSMEPTISEIKSIILFLRLLEDTSFLNNKFILPNSVPSGLDIDDLKEEDDNLIESKSYS